MRSTSSRSPRGGRRIGCEAVTLPTGARSGAPSWRRPARERPSPAWPHRHLLDTDVLTWPQIELVLDTADAHGRRSSPASGPGRRRSAGVGVTNLFYEASTRTRVSFEVAAKHLSADVVNVAASGSSIEKGESLLDTMRTLEALGAGSSSCGTRRPGRRTSSRGSSGAPSSTPATAGTPIRRRRSSTCTPCAARSRAARSAAGRS